MGSRGHVEVKGGGMQLLALGGSRAALFTSGIEAMEGRVDKKGTSARFFLK